MLKTDRLAASSGKVGVCDEQASLSIGAVGTARHQNHLKLPELVDKLSIAPDALLDPLAGMQHCGMVAPAERLAELLEGRIGELTREIDRHVARPGYAGGPGLR